jgi:CheY-like chemotaxis protein
MPTATVLLIDANPEDEQLFREELALIRDRPFELQVARTLSEALTRIKQGRLDVIVVDLNLPDSLGLTTFLRPAAQGRPSSHYRAGRPGRRRPRHGGPSSVVRSTTSSNSRWSAIYSTRHCGMPPNALIRCWR